MDSNVVLKLSSLFSLLFRPLHVYDASSPLRLLFHGMSAQQENHGMMRSMDSVPDLQSCPRIVPRQRIQLFNLLIHDFVVFLFFHPQSYWANPTLQVH